MAANRTNVQKALGGLFCSAVLACGLISIAPRIALADKVVENPEYVEALDRLAGISDELEELGREQGETGAKLEEVRGQISENETKIEGVQEDIDRCKLQIIEKQAALSSQIQTRYKTGNINLVSLILDSSSLEEAISKIYYYNSVSQYQTEQIEAINTIKAELQDNQRELEELQQELEEQEASYNELYEEQTARVEEMSARQSEAIALVNSLPPELVIPEETKEIVEETRAVAEMEEAAQQQSSEQSTGDSNSNEESSNSDQGNQQPATPSTPAAPAPSEAAPGGSLERVLNLISSRGAPDNPGWGCSGYVYCIFRDAGISNFSGPAYSFYNAFCFSSDRSELKPGMIIGVSTHSRSNGGRTYGHIAIYIGNNTVAEYGTLGRLYTPLDQFLNYYGTSVPVRWGWNGGVPLS